MLFRSSARAKRAVGREHAATYMSIASMFIESAMPYAVTGLIFIITYAINSNVQNLVLPVLSQMVCISPELIILRVAMGRAVSASTYVRRTPARRPSNASMEFRTPQASREGGFQLSAIAHSENTLKDSMGTASKDWFPA